MTRTGYALGMNATPSDPNHINTRALEGMMRAFDRAVMGKYGLGSVAPQATDPQEESMLRELELQIVRKVLMREEAVKLKQVEAVKLEQEEQTRLSSFWYTFPIVKHIVRFFYPPRFTQHKL